MNNNVKPGPSVSTKRGLNNQKMQLVDALNDAVNKAVSIRSSQCQRTGALNWHLTHSNGDEFVITIDGGFPVLTDEEIKQGSISS